MNHNHSKEALEKIANNIRYLQEKEQEIKDEIKATYDEAKSQGFDTKIIKKLIKITDKDKFQEELTLMELYAETIQPDLFK